MWAILGIFFVYFHIFKQKCQFIQQINVKNVHPVYLWCWDSNSRHLEHESPPITTRPGLLPLGTKSLWYLLHESPTISSGISTYYHLSTGFFCQNLNPGIVGNEGELSISTLGDLSYSSCSPKLAKKAFLNGLNPASYFVYFGSFLTSHGQIKHKFDYKWKKRRWHAWESNPGRQDGRRRWIHWAMAAPQKSLSRHFWRSQPQNI